IANALGEQGVDPRRLVLEVTESTAMRNPEATAELLYELKQAGVLVAVDDFGLGYSSLAYLKRFPVDILKIDRSFVRGIGTDSKDERLIEAVIALSHGLGVQVLAEGVEHQRQLNYLVAEGCDLVQGFLIGDAMAAADLQHGLAGAAGTALGLEAIEAMQQRPFPED
ncbi:MAG: EAL domain-containing protein, partial [Gemmatimonadetes bacterium]|nr:EAL domain-containing protein [Gemmatimonadota bacterium]